MNLLAVPRHEPTNDSHDCTAAQTAEPAVVLRRVRKSYTRGSLTTQVINDVDFTAKRGEVVFLLGPSGSGKTTLLSMIGCVLSADEGTVRVLGRDVGRLSPDEAADLRRDHIGFVFQRFHLIRGLTATENVAVPLVLAGWTQLAAAFRAGELLNMVGLHDHASAQPHRLSVGQCQRIAFARALAADPELILADEPTASLDAKTGQQAIELLHRLTVRSGKTVIVVTHDSRILDFADRIVYMESGTLVERSPNYERQSDQLKITEPCVAAH